MDPALFKIGMRRLLSGLSLITTQWEGRPHGLIVTSLSSLSVEPPSLIVCVNKSASAHEPLLRSRKLSANVLSAEQGGLVSLFSSSHSRAERFKGGEWACGETGTPVFHDSLAVFECEISDVISKYSHSIIVAEVVNTHVNQRIALAPMSYFDGKSA